MYYNHYPPVWKSWTSHCKAGKRKLNIQYYDRDIVEQASEQLCLPVSQIDQLEEKAEKATRNGFMRMMYPLGTQTSAMQNKIFEAQKNIMRFWPNANPAS